MSNVSVTLTSANVTVDQANSAVTVGTTTSNVAVSQMSTITITGGGNPFDQNLNTTDSVQFVSANLTANLSVTGTFDCGTF